MNTETALPNSEKLKVIANEFTSQKVDARSHAEVYAEMSAWAEKGHLSQKFIDNCYEAISEGKYVLFSYAPGEYYHFLYGKDKAQVDAAFAKIKKGKYSFADANGNPIKKRNPFFDKWSNKK